MTKNYNDTETDSRNSSRGEGVLSEPIEYMDADTQSVLAEHVESGKNLGALLNARAATKAGASLVWINKATCVANYENKRVLISGYMADQSQVGARIVGNKYLVKRFLEDAGAPTSRGRLVGSPEAAIQTWREFQAPVVLKPVDAFGGKGVTVNLDSEEGIRAAFLRAANFSSGQVLLEEHVDGVEEYRCLATPERCVSIVKRLLPNVVGDGKSSIVELIESKNDARRLNPSTVNRYIPIDDVTEGYLARDDRTLDTVLPEGERITVRDVGGLSSGGEPQECLAEASAELRAAAVSAVRAIPGLSWGGVDIMISTADGKPSVIEINSSADIAGSTFPMYGTPRDVADVKWENRMMSAHVDEPIRPQPSVSLGRMDRLSVAKLFSNTRAQNSASFQLSRLITWVLESRTYEIATQGAGIISVTDDDGAAKWFTQDFTGVRDHAVSCRAVRRHGTVRSLLRLAKVHRPRGIELKSMKELRRFVATTEQPVVLVPARGSWRSDNEIIVAQGSDLESTNLASHNRWIAQIKTPGPSFRVIATPERSLWVLGTGHEGRVPKADEIRAAEISSVQAVKAIPQLRWAAVDVVVRENHGAYAAVVEGLSINPQIEGHQIQEAGSIHDVIDKIIR